MPELKPCPFCGNKVDFVYDYKMDPTGIYCGRCAMKIIFNFGIRSKRETYEETREKWADRWNARAGGFRA